MRTSRDAGLDTVIGHVPCIVCGGSAALTKYAEAIWGVANGMAAGQGWSRLSEREIATCSPACYVEHKRKLFAGDLEWQERERNRLAQEAERAEAEREAKPRRQRW